MRHKSLEDFLSSELLHELKDRYFSSSGRRHAELDFALDCWGINLYIREAKAMTQQTTKTENKDLTLLNYLEKELNESSSLEVFKAKLKDLRTVLEEREKISQESSDRNLRINYHDYDKKIGLKMTLRCGHVQMEMAKTRFYFVSP
jgi:hypothetical protein